MAQTETDELIRRAIAKDPHATEQLIVRHRERLRKMVAVRFDRRMGARIDPSDIVQETLIRAMAKLPQYLEERPIAFYPWLRQLAWEQMVESFRKHILAQRRSVDREVNLGGQASPPLPDQSTAMLADLLVARQSNPSHRLEREQIKERVQNALTGIRTAYREVLVMRYLEELSMQEIADCLDTTESAIKMRHMRALKQLGSALSNLWSSNES